MPPHPLRVLLVEDDDADALLLHHTVAAAHDIYPLHVERARDLAAAITASHGPDHDVVLLDLGLPDSQGLDTFHRFREAGAELPVVVLTGTSDDEVALAAVEAGAQDFLSKGDLSHLPVGRILHYAVERHRLQAGLRQQAASLAASERELAASEARFRDLVELADDVLYRLTLTSGLHVDYVSPAVVDATGVPAEDFHADPQVWQKHIHPGDLAAWQDRTQLDAGEADCVVLRWRLPDGSWAWLEDRRIPVLVDGRLVAVQGIMRDVSLRERTEEALRRALQRERTAVERLQSLDELKGTFLQAVSHELRTPLTVIRGFAATLRDQDEVLDAAQRAHMLDRLSAASTRLERLLVDLLDVDRLERGQVPLDRARTDVRALVDRVLAEVPPDHHPMTVACAGDLVADVDGAKVERVVENLLRNAVKHTPQGTHIHLAATGGPDGLTLTVEDDGPGVAAELADRIFDPFAQGPTASHASSPGTGIGLALVARFAELHGGGARVEPRIGGGTRFVVEFPSGAPAATTRPGAPHRQRRLPRPVAVRS